MEGVHSFEKRSQTESDRLRGNRIIIADRHDPNVSWNTTNQTTQSRGLQCWSWFSGLSQCGWFSSCKQRQIFSQRRQATATTTKAAPTTGSTRKPESLSIALNSVLDDYITFDSGPFPSNEWRTSKYTLLSFLPKNLFEQFRRLANFYFLITGIIQLSIPFSPVGPFTSLTPLFFVVTTTAIKQAYEDYLRHKLDNEVNNRTCHVLRNKKLHHVRSKDIRVGDIVQVKNNEEIPCDMILLATSGTGDRCYVTTANLDGETSLKSRTCFAIRSQIGPIQKIDDTLLMIECERPNATLYEFNGILRAPKDSQNYDKLIEDAMDLSNNNNVDAKTTPALTDEKKKANKLDSSNQQRHQQQLEQTLSNDQTGDRRISIIRRIYKQLKRTKLNLLTAQQKLAKETNTTASRLVRPEHFVESSAENVEISLDISNLLLRASRLRNTNFVYGLVVHTGMDTKLAYNSQVKPNKFSSTETRVNLFLFIAFVLLITLTIISTIYSNWHKYRGPPAGNRVAQADLDGPEVKSENISQPSDEMPVHSLFVKSNSKTNYTLIENFLAQFLLYNYIVPISLYVTLEFVKFFGTLSVINDKKLRVLVWKTTSNQETLNAVNSSDGAATAAGTTNKQQQSATANNASTASNQPPSRRIQVLERPQCNSSDLNEDLGQVEVLVTDKTGTLTENKMRFRACSVYGQLFRCVSSQLYQQPAGWCNMMVPNLVARMTNVQTNRYAAIGPTSAASYTSHTSHSGVGGSSSERGSHGVSIAGSSTRVSANPRELPFDHRFVPPLNELKLVSDKLENYEKVVEFFICLCLCSTITLNETTPIADCLPDKIAHDFQSASPDEESLIAAANQFGITMCKSNERECFIAIRRSADAAAALPPPKSPSRSPKATSSPTAAAAATTTTAKSIKTGKANSAGVRFLPIVETKLSNDRFIVRHFERLLAFEFDSTRKRMSVIYRDCDNNCKLMVTKGSESVLDCIRLSQLNASMELNINLTLAHFEAFAKSGLRTMLVAKRLVADKEYERILVEMRLARMAGTSREQLLENLYKRVEVDLSFVGTTAVEDTLQEGVPETIAQLKEAGIKVWLLTGDKVETAVSVAYLCKLLDRNMSLVYLVRQQDAKMCVEKLAGMVKELEMANAEYEQNNLASATEDRSHAKSSAAASNLESIRRLKSARVSSLSSKHKSSPTFKPQPATLADPKSQNFKSRPPLTTQQQHQQTAPATSLDEPLEDDQAPRFGLIVDGRSLHYAMKYARTELEIVCKCCTCVLGCRLSPLQKAEVVSMIKSGEGEPITAAIGDGANDVSMIQEAHVGIGISGKEGRQAVNSSDFAIKRFHMLSRLFFVHGHYFYHRTVNTIHYFFYKNLLFIIPQFIYSFYSSSKSKPATSIYHPIMLITFNLMFTSLPILMYGLLERHLSESLLDHQPRLYRINKHNHQMRLRVFLSWIILALIQGNVAYYWLAFIWEKPWPIEADDKTFLMSASSPETAATSRGATTVLPATDKLIHFSIILYCVIVFAATIKLYFLSKYRNLYFNLAALISILFLPICFYLFSIINWMPLLSTNSLYYRFIPLLSIPMFWLALASTVAATTIPDMIFTYCHR